MPIKITGAPCSWGVDDPKNPYLPPWKDVLSEASAAGYKGLELGPYGYLPLELDTVSHEFNKNGLSIVAGTIFDDLVNPDNLENLIRQVHDICSLTTKLPHEPQQEKQHFSLPYLVIIDWGHDERDYGAGHPDTAPRLNEDQWQTMMSHIRTLSRLAWDEYKVRAVIHPHAGGYIEFADEIIKVAEDIPYETAGFCLDSGHLRFSRMDPEEWIERYADRIDYLHFKDIDMTVYDRVMGERIRFFEAVAEGVMCPIGKGVINYPGILALLKKIGYSGYITIEQERDPRNSETRLRDVKASLDYLKEVGF